MDHKIMEYCTTVACTCPTGNLANLKQVEEARVETDYKKFYNKK